MRQFNLPPPDEQCLNEMRAALSSWLRDRCAHGKAHAEIKWMMTMTVNAFFNDEGDGHTHIGVRTNDAIGGSTNELAPASPPKKQKRVIHTNADLRKIEKDVAWKRKMAQSPPAEEPKFPDTFRYRERENG